MPVLFSVRYEGRDADELVGVLVSAGVDVLVDGDSAVPQGCATLGALWSWAEGRLQRAVAGAAG